MKVCRKFKLTYFWAKRRKSNNRSPFQILMWSECQIHFMFVIRHSISIPTVQVLNADDRFEIHKSDSDSSPTFWSRWSGKYKRYIMKKRETREKHENAYHGLRLREEECAKWNAPNWTWVRLCFRDHSQNTNVYTRQFVPENISSQSFLFKERQLTGDLFWNGIWGFFSLERK